MKIFKLFLLPTNFAFCTLILSFLSTVTMAMLLKNVFIMAQKPSFSVQNKKFKSLHFVVNLKRNIFAPSYAKVRCLLLRKARALKVIGLMAPRKYRENAHLIRAQKVTGLNPVEVTTLKKPRSNERGSLFYGEIELAQNFGINQRTSLRKQALFLICNFGLILEKRS